MTPINRVLSLLNVYARIAKGAGQTEELSIWNMLIEQCKGQTK